MLSTQQVNDLEKSPAQMQHGISQPCGALAAVGDHFYKMLLAQDDAGRQTAWGVDEGVVYNAIECSKAAKAAYSQQDYAGAIEYTSQVLYMAAVDHTTSLKEYLALRRLRIKVGIEWFQRTKAGRCSSPAPLQPLQRLVLQDARCCLAAAGQVPQVAPPLPPPPPQHCSCNA